MPRSTSPKPGTQDKPVASLPDPSTFIIVGRLLDKLEEMLNDNEISNYSVGLAESVCNGFYQTTGFGIILNTLGEFALATPCGIITASLTIIDESAQSEIFDDLQEYLDSFCTSVSMDDTVLNEFDELGEMLVGFWVLTIEDTILESHPRLIPKDEGHSPLELEDAWETLTKS